jgi:glutamate-ammonia-ligase adenylyltransferase
MLAAVVMAAVDRSAAPAAVRAALRRLLEVRPELADRLAEDASVREALIAVLAASRSLTRYFESSPDTIDVLSRLDEREPRVDTTVADLVAWKQREFVRITARDLTGTDWLVHTTAALTDLAADVLDGACLLARALSASAGDGATNGHARLAVIGMGKLGGSELNYASDVDVMFVGDGPAEALERQARAVIDIAGHCFRIDTNLRPQGRDGALVRSLDSYEAYWDRWASPWEFQALIKARPVAGDAKLGAVFGDTAHRWLWSHPFAADDLRSVRQMKRRTETEVARKGLTDRDIKRGRGGIRDIEFTVQLLQLVHGHAGTSAPSNTACNCGTNARSTPCPPTARRSIAWPASSATATTPAPAPSSNSITSCCGTSSPFVRSTSASTSARCSKRSPRRRDR